MNLRKAHRTDRLRPMINRRAFSQALSAALFGGRGFVLGTLLGSLIIGTLNNGLVLLGVSSSLQLVIKGAIIVAAVAFTRR